MKTHVITATDASRTFSEVLNHVYYRHQCFAVKRGNKIIAKILPSDSPSVMNFNDLKQLFQSLPVLDPKDKKDFEKILHTVRKSAKLPENLWD